MGGTLIYLAGLHITWASLVDKIGYLREARVGGRIGRIYPLGEVVPRGRKAEAEDTRRSR